MMLNLQMQTRSKMQMPYKFIISINNPAKGRVWVNILHNPQAVG